MGSLNVTSLWPTHKWSDLCPKAGQTFSTFWRWNTFYRSQLLSITLILTPGFFSRTKRAFKKINHKILLLASLSLTNSLPRHTGFCTLTELPTWVKPWPFGRQRQNSIWWLDFTLWGIFSKYTFQHYKMSCEPHANTTSTTHSQMFLHWHEQSWHLPSCGFAFSVYRYLDLNFGRKWLFMYLST